MKNVFALFGILVCVVLQAGAEPTTAAISGFQNYVRGVEARLSQEHRSRGGFLAASASVTGQEAHLRSGELVIERLTPPGGSRLPGALIHDWRGTAFAPGATAATFESMLRDFAEYPQRFAPEVFAARLKSGQGDQLQAWMRVRQKHVLTVVMDTTYDVNFGRLDERDRFSSSRSLRIDEISGAGNSHERALGPDEEHGFLWRLNTYWTYQERDGGLYIQVESVSLSRAIPTGLGWAVTPFVESVPRESLEFTLRSACAAVHKEAF